MKTPSVRLVSWNIRWGRGLDDRVDIGRQLADLENFTDFDILCLQEVASGFDSTELRFADGSDQFEMFAAALGDYHAVSGFAVDRPAKSGRQRRFGNMILSRFPVLQIRRHSLPGPADPDVSTMPRMALETILETPLGNLRVITPHLEFYSERQRMAQVGYLRNIVRESGENAALEKVADATGPYAAEPETAGILLAGDFNFRPYSGEWHKLLSPFGGNIPALKDAWKIVHPGEKHAPTMGHFDHDRWPDGPFVSDYVFVSGELASLVKDMRVETGSRASDHQAVLLELG